MATHFQKESSRCFKGIVQLQPLDIGADVSFARAALAGKLQFDPARRALR
jgi:hypothetical protein